MRILFFEGVPGLDRLLAGKGFAIRSCENYRRLGPRDYRIAVRTGEENEALLQALDELEKRAVIKKGREKVWQKSDDSGDDVQCGKNIPDRRNSARSVSGRLPRRPF